MSRSADLDDAVAAFLSKGNKVEQEARERYPSVAAQAENAAEARNEQFGRSRLGGATVSDALDDANEAAWRSG